MASARSSTSAVSLSRATPSPASPSPANGIHMYFPRRSTDAIRAPASARSKLTTRSAGTFLAEVIPSIRASSTRARVMVAPVSQAERPRRTDSTSGSSGIQAPAPLRAQPLVPVPPRVLFKNLFHRDFRSHKFSVFLRRAFTRCPSRFTQIRHCGKHARVIGAFTRDVVVHGTQA